MIMTEVCTACSIAVDKVELDTPFDGDERGLDDNSVVAVALAERSSSLEKATGLPELNKGFIGDIESCLE
ncbi:hypothetical protein C491_13457 [Natronococcus amylolyticus DSM 10524]|uniref:Uncharacterized protein n=1 Tax=Natronococcus amylolyticus DSM 10524 TaxID=1227497 RepID=L9X465_9EURY|nr:hypothetical protein C491_13457 [Natronococcus amylolyticus DSM 10524]